MKYNKKEDFAFDSTGNPATEYFRPIIGLQNIADFMKVGKKAVASFIQKDMKAWGLAWYTGKRLTTTPFLINIYYCMKTQAGWKNHRKEKWSRNENYVSHRFNYCELEKKNE
jgi:hypothetical protein